ncbi:hypothetical protein FOYG_17169 [Fusarium oxysporum NRRL 32931]|uniref:Uncharacterized protein n=1 Tax=Fusarium oxysporum NRRL 32931 TaxID=660029 RepID=W9HAV4_FUSOX|nr:hypothetical protein FOYG_17169 [Fusarium oxysporum NRRL 32931]
MTQTIISALLEWLSIQDIIAQWHFSITVRFSKQTVYSRKNIPSRPSIILLALTRMDQSFVLLFRTFHQALTGLRATKASCGGRCITIPRLLVKARPQQESISSRFVHTVQYTAQKGELSHLLNASKSMKRRKDLIPRKRFLTGLVRGRV